MSRPPSKVRPLIALSIPGYNNDVFTRAVVDTANELDWDLLDLNTTRQKLPDGIRPQGLIYTDMPNDPIVRSCRDLGAKCVRKGKYEHHMDKKFPAVLPNHFASGELAARHFASLGFKHVGMIINEPRAHPDLKFEGFQQGADELGMTFHVMKKPPNIRPEAAEPMMGEWLQELPKPVGILAYHDILAVRLNLIAQSAGLLVPEEVALLGPDNSIQCEISPVPISAIDMDMAAFGRQTALILQRMIDGEDPPGRTYIEAKGIVVRRSTDVLAVADLVVAKAMTYIWEHYDWPLTVDDVAYEVDVARSTLERKFRKHLGRGVNAELGRKRLEKCSELLRGTDMNMEEIAKATGFRDRSYLHRVFRKEFGVTPAAYRRQND